MRKATNRAVGSKAVGILSAAALALGLCPALGLPANQASASQAAHPSVREHIAASLDGDHAKAGGGIARFAAFMAGASAGDGLRDTGHDVVLKYTMADAGAVAPGETIDDVWSDPERAGEKILGQYTSFADVYDPGDGGKYYVVFVDSTRLNEAGETLDVQFTLANLEGRAVDDVAYDMRSGVAYIPKSHYFAEDGTELAYGLQAQVLVGVDLSGGRSTKVDVEVESTAAGVSPAAERAVVDVDPVEPTVTIPVVAERDAGKVALEDIELYADGSESPIALDSGNAVYDPETGELEFAMSGIALTSLRAKITSATAAERPQPRVQDAGSLMCWPIGEFTGLDTSVLSEGQLIQYQGYVRQSASGYADQPSWTHIREARAFAAKYGYTWSRNGIGLSGPGTTAGLMDAVLHGGTWDSLGGPGMTTLENSTAHMSIDVPFVFDGPSGDMAGTNWDGVYDEWNNQVYLHGGSNAVANAPTFAAYCAHASHAVDASGEWKYSTINMRVLKIAEDYVVLGFVLPHFYTQSGVAVYKFKVASKGDLEIRKASGNAEITDGNPCYSLEGATFDVYDSNHVCVATITTDAEGYGKVEGLKAGRYYLKETAAPKGYLVNAEWEANGGSEWVDVPSGGTGSIECVDQPGNDPDGVLLQKIDAETSEKVPQGASSLAMAEYTFEYYPGHYQTADEAKASGDPARTWVLRTNENGYTGLMRGDETFEHDGSTYPYKVSGDEFYREHGLITVPLGTVVAHETKAPEGYNISDKVFVSRVVMDESGNATTEGDQLAIDGNTGKPTTVAAEQPKRGDMRFVKRDAETGKAMPGVPFLVTSRSSGEHHVAVTDVNGVFDSTLFDETDPYNASDAALSGDTESGWKVDEEKLDPTGAVWFGGEAEKGASGAFLYGTYDIEEIPCSANEGRMLASATAVVTRDSKVVDPTLHVGTRATAADGSKALPVLPEATLVDRVEWGGGQTGADLFVTTQIKDMTTGEAVTLSNGSKSIETHVEDAPAAGSVSIEASFSTLGLAGRTLYVAETVKDSKGRVLAEHDDANDTEQQVGIVSPEIGTTLSTPEGAKTVCASKDAVLVDVVSYENLAAGVEHVASGELRDRATGEPLIDANGEAITASAVFTPEKPCGTVEVSFEFDGSNIASDVTAVAFEEVSVGGRVVAEHKDIEDGDQSAVVGPGTLGTELLASGSHSATAAPDATLVDTVSFEKLPEAQLEGWGILMDASTGLPFVSGDSAPTEEDLSEWFDGVLAALGAQRQEDETWTCRGEVDWSAVKAAFDSDPSVRDAVSVASAQFQGGAAGSYSLEFPCDLTAASGKSIVALEIAMRHADDGASEVVGSHADLSDKGQTVDVGVPEIGTELVDVTDGDHSALASTACVLVDTVRYEGLTPGLSYTVAGELRDKATGEVVEVAGKPVAAEATFVPNAASGSVEVEFSLDASKLGGATVVAFEELSLEGELIAEHKDIEDEAQSVSIAFPPVGTSSAGTPWDKTGGLGWTALVALGIGAAVVAGLSVYAVRQRRFAKRGGLFREPEER